MGKKSVWIILLLCSFTMFLGCSAKTTNVQESDQLELEQPQKDSTEGKKAVKEQQEGTEPEPIVVRVMDPTTKGVIKTIIPDDMGFGTDDAQYKNELETWAKELARGTDSSPGYDQRNAPDRIDENGQIIKGTPRVILEEAELVEKIIATSKTGGEVELPLHITASGYETEEALNLDEVVIASYTTYFDPNVTGRNKNIELSAKAIEKVIVGVDDHFSFNTTVGPSDEEHGYQPAQEAVNGKLVMGIGGGICQTSSTLFNAVDQLAVDYVEWHHHSVAVGYVPAGRDATVSYGGKDFRFLNTTGVPFLIKTIYENSSLTVEIRTSSEYANIIKKAV